MNRATNERAFWALTQVDALKLLWSKEVPAKEIGLALGRTVKAIRSKAADLGLPSREVDSDYQNFWKVGDRLEVLKRLYDEGATFSHMAAQIGDGCSRSACVGKAQRMGWTRSADIEADNRAGARRKATRASVEAAKARRVSKPAKPRLSVISNRQVFAQPDEPRPPRAFVPRFVDEPGSATILTIGDRMCRWPIGDPQSDDFTLCGAYAHEGRVYCCAHHRRAVDPNQPKDAKPNQLIRSLRRYA